MVQLDCGLVRTEGLSRRSTEGKVARKEEIARKEGIARKEEFVSEGRVCVGRKSLCRKEGSLVDGIVAARRALLSERRVG
jgi:hypothetical protein